MTPLFVPRWPSRGFCDFCRYQIRKGLMLRYWITLPTMWRREQQFRRELTDCLNGHNIPICLKPDVNRTIPTTPEPRP